MPEQDDLVDDIACRRRHLTTALRQFHEGLPLAGGGRMLGGRLGPPASSLAKLHHDLQACDFSCGTCMNICPAKAISFKVGKRSRPPADKFAKIKGDR